MDEKPPVSSPSSPVSAPMVRLGEIQASRSRGWLDALDPVTTLVSKLTSEAAAALRQHESETTRLAVQSCAGNLAAQVAEAVHIDTWSPANVHTLVGDVDLSDRIDDIVGPLASIVAFPGAGSIESGPWEAVGPAVADTVRLLRDAGLVGELADPGLARTRNLVDLPGSWDLAAHGLSAPAILDGRQEITQYTASAMQVADFYEDAARYEAAHIPVAVAGFALAHLASEFGPIPELDPSMMRQFAWDVLRIADLGPDLAELSRSLPQPIDIGDHVVHLPLSLAPGTEEGDFLLIPHTRADPDERLAALKRVAKRMGLLRHLRSAPGILRVLFRQAEERGVSVDEVLTIELAAAMVLVLGSDTQPRTIRLGRNWITDERRKKVVYPPDQFDVWIYRRWFKAAVIRTAKQSLFDRPDVLPTGRGRPIEEREGPVQVIPLPVGFGGDEFDLTDEQADDPLALLVAESDHDEARRRLAVVLDLATPRQRQIMELLAHGLTNAEIAQRLGISEATVRVQCHRFYNKARVTGLAA